MVRWVENEERRGRCGVEARKRTLHFHSHQSANRVPEGDGRTGLRWRAVMLVGTSSQKMTHRPGTGLFQRSKGRASQWKFNGTNIDPPSPRIKRFLRYRTPLTNLRIRSDRRADASLEQTAVTSRGHTRHTCSRSSERTRAPSLCARPCTLQGPIPTPPIDRRYCAR
jgi:hypothetical protein